MSFSHDDFLRALDEHDFSFEVGQTVKGKISSHANDGAYVDIGGKSAAFLPLGEVTLGADQKLDAVFPLATEREFLIIRGQDENGQLTLSVRQLEIKALWATLQAFEPGQTLTTRVTGLNKGGLMTNVKGIKAFIPRSHVVQRENLEELVGQRLTVCILEADPERRKLVLSQRQARRAERITELAIGQLASGIVTDHRPFGAFVDLKGITALLHINNISQKYISSVEAILPKGTAIQAIVVDIDQQRGRISLSTSVLENRPGEMLEEMATVMAEAEQRAERYYQKMMSSDLPQPESDDAPAPEPAEAELSEPIAPKVPEPTEPSTPEPTSSEA